MGLDLSALWEQGKQQIQNQIDSFVQTGVPAIQSGVEKSAIEWLQKSNQATQARLEQGIQQQLQGPPSAFGDAIKEAFSGAASKQYGMYIVLGVAGVGILGYLLLKK